MNNGFIYPFFDSLVRLMYYCNLVELFKFFAKLYTGIMHKRNGDEVTTPDVIRSCNIAIDIYQVFKFSVLLLLWVCEVNSVFSKIVICYLLFVIYYSQIYLLIFIITFGVVNLDKELTGTR